MTPLDFNYNAQCPNCLTCWEVTKVSDPTNSDKLAPMLMVCYECLAAVEIDCDMKARTLSVDEIKSSPQDYQYVIEAQRRDARAEKTGHHRIISCPKCQHKHNAIGIMRKGETISVCPNCTTVFMAYNDLSTLPISMDVVKKLPQDALVKIMREKNRLLAEHGHIGPLVAGACLETQMENLTPEEWDLLHQDAA